MSFVSSAQGKSRPAGDALYDLAILEMDCVMDDGLAKKALDRYLQSSSKGHPKRAEAMERRKELGE